MNFLDRFGLFYLLSLNTIWSNIWMSETQTTNNRLKKIEENIDRMSQLKYPK